METLRKASADLESQKDAAKDSLETPTETLHEIKTEHCGYLNVYVQGDTSSISPTTPVFLTVHDLGSNHFEFHKLVNHPCMARMRARSVWIHVDLPGQQFDAPDLPANFEFPSFDKIAIDLLAVLDHLNIKYCVAFGEGAGANILLRFALDHPHRILGTVLVHCVVSVESVTKYVQDKIMSWRLNSFGMNSTADQYLVYHKFGMYIDSRKDLDHEQVINRFLEQLHRRMNPKNLRLFVDAYLSRSDLTNAIKEKLKVDTMIVSGSYDHLMHCTDVLQAAMDPRLTTRVNIEHCGSVISEVPEMFYYDLLLFCQGLGLFSSLPMSRNGSISASN